MFSALRNGGGNVALNAYAAQAVVAWMKGEHADMALVDVGGSTYAAELPQADGTVLIATVNRPDPNGKTVRLRAAIAKPVVGTADYTFTSLPTIDRSCEVNLAPIYLCLLPIATSIWGGVGQDLNTITQQYTARTPFDEGCFRRICDTLVVMLNNNEVDVKVPGGNIDILTGTSVKSGSLSGTELCGKACVLCGSIRVTATKAHTFASAKKLFSCRPVDPSVIRRCAFVIDSYELTKETLLARVRYNTGFPDKDLLEKMYTVWLAISKHCKENDITEGSISATELEMWAQSVQVDGMSNVRENCRCCVVSKATSVVEEQEEIMGSVVDLYL